MTGDVGESSGITLLSSLQATKGIIKINSCKKFNFISLQFLL